MRNPHKALEAIERLVGGGFGMDMECFLAGMSPIKDKELLALLSSTRLNDLKSISNWIEKEIPTFKTETAGGMREIVLKDDVLEYFKNLMEQK